MVSLHLEFKFHNTYIYPNCIYLYNLLLINIIDTY